MTTFEEFMSDPRRASTNSDAVTAKRIRNETLMQVLPNAFGEVTTSEKKKQIEEFETKVERIVHSESFIAELSDRIGDPREGESEDDFVNRAKSTMTDLLDKAISKRTR